MMATTNYYIWAKGGACILGIIVALVVVNCSEEIEGAANDREEKSKKMVKIDDMEKVIVGSSLVKRIDGIMDKEQDILCEEDEKFFIGNGIEIWPKARGRDEVIKYIRMGLRSRNHVIRLNAAWRIKTLGEKIKKEESEEESYRLLPYMQMALYRTVSDGERSRCKAGPNTDMSAFGGDAVVLIEQLGAFPHITSVDVLLYVFNTGGIVGDKYNICRDINSFAVEPLLHCTNGILGNTEKSFPGRYGSYFGYHPTMKEVGEWIRIWSELRPRLQERGIIGEEPEWGVVSRMKRKISEKKNGVRVQGRSDR